MKESFISAMRELPGVTILFVPWDAAMRADRDVVLEAALARLGAGSS